MTSLHSTVGGKKNTSKTWYPQLGLLLDSHAALEGKGECVAKSTAVTYLPCD